MTKLSIITINFNDAIGLQKTLDSIAVQSFTDYEQVIIDGGSTDGRVNIVANIFILLSRVDWIIGAPPLRNKMERWPKCINSRMVKAAFCFR
ncbi:MAG: glycosyltransferase [Paludibacter sp.]|nr:glycosyltransferase [Paludibacter sp.]